MDYTYEDYRHALISVGDAMLMNLSYNWDRKLFNKKMHKQLWEDMSLTSDQVHSIMMVANSYLETALFLRMMAHPKFDTKQIDYWLEKLNWSPASGQNFYANLFRYDLWQTQKHIERATMQWDPVIDIAVMENERVRETQGHIIVDILVAYARGGYADKLERLQKYVSEHEDELSDFIMEVYTEYEIEEFLPKTAQDVFLF